MGGSGRLLFDLNELPEEEVNVDDCPIVYQPQKSLPVSTLNSSTLLPSSEACQRIQNNHAFTHASIGSCFQPFVRKEVSKKPKEFEKLGVESNTDQASTSVASSFEDVNKINILVQSGCQGGQTVEREEGEWSDMDVNGDDNASISSNKQEILDDETTEKQIMNEESRSCGKADGSGHNNSSLLGITVNEVCEPIRDPNENLPVSENYATYNSRVDAPVDGFGESSSVKPREVKGVEASHALRFASNPVKRPKIDEHKEAMLGKKRARQTVFINVEDAKQASSMKTTPRRQTSFPATVVTRTVKDSSRASTPVIERGTERPNTKDQKQSDFMSTEGSSTLESGNLKNEPNGDAISGPGRPKKLNHNEVFSETYPSVSKQVPSKQSVDTRQFTNSSVSSRKPLVSGLGNTDQKLGVKKNTSSKRQNSINHQYQDTSVERLLREVTSEKFWHHPEETDLQRVPGQFESVEEYVRVFEPLLFEECRAQLNSTYEELQENTTRDAYIMVRIKNVERRERGWFDVIVLPVHECKWNFKEGDVAVLAYPSSGAGRSGRRGNYSTNDDDAEHETPGRVVGTVRRHIPIDTRDQPGAIFHFYVGDLYDSSSKSDDHILRKLEPKTTWYLTTLGSLATTQREYIALHAFRHLNTQMQSAILKPSPEHFPKYEERPPAMPDCFTQNFVDHLHRTFNLPQLAAIQWAAMHTAAGTNSRGTKRQDPWPFTLVQGPPGTGKTHTVWGMLNVIHLVQYQHYYTALLKKLAPESYKQTTEINLVNASSGSIDEVLQNMDQSLLRTLPKLCPKPRMLVCAPSNAATDELLARVLDRGFIDGEMKVYRPDVARVGVDSQTRAAQAVSVERRTEQLLQKSRDEVIKWLHDLKCREAELAQQIARLQRELSVAAAAGRSQGSVGVDPDVLAARDQNRDMLLQYLAAAIENRDKVLVDMSRFLILESKFRSGINFNMEDARANLEASFANEAEIVFTTVSSSGRKIFSRLTHGFDMVVIDEAAQASEVAILPPLSLGAARCVLVGDPQQLPATVISKAAGTLLYSRSLFERFQQAGCPTLLLSVQYRMHPQIRDFPSRYFYQGRLTDSESVVNLEDEVYYRDPLLHAYAFYDITHGRESHRGGSVSYQNVHEAQFSLRLYEHLQKFVKSNGGKRVTVGIITPYKLQLKCLQREFEDVLKSEEGKDIYINTVDAFQGQERDVIIMSCVRASNHGVGFVADIRRMNVALTRARRALWVVGNANALMQSEDWAALIDDAKSRKCFIDMESIPKEFLLLKGSATAPAKPTLNSTRSSRSGHRQRHLDVLPEPKSGTQSEEEDKPNHFPSRNGSYKNVKMNDASLDDIGHSIEKSKNPSQYSMSKRQNTSGSSK
ncbi:probable helicase DDB_G0274399 [Zingiber officinale]|uniref:probable helicase DDB_G0274399 n=1 Tax=Zingiber officinale TaxID=94328 RepID=UPI001C4B82AF|nr:probable helicase DDB_G0274399 [Zingiber officinale]XP_042377229.1 probable helicase DDB_G0274399 [Zingiber officinale]